jgi:hypothetical protein
MAQNEKRRQKALFKKRRKDKERKSTLSNGSSFNSFSKKIGLVKRAKECPIYECLISDDWENNGLVRILLSRRQPNSNLIIGVYLVDVYCLGLKNTFCNANIAVEDYQALKEKMFQAASLIDCHPGLANRIIYGAIEYARKLGFEPQKDFSMSHFILDAPSDADLSFKIEFGKDGKPLYVAGPDDDSDYVIKKLIESVGEGNFDYLVTL